MYYPILFGMLCGTIIYILKFDLISLFDKEIQFFKVGDASAHLSNYFLYIIRQRLISFIVIIVFTFLFSYKISIVLINMLLGIYYGIVSCTLFCEFGFISYKYIIGLFFPHYIIYIICLYLTGKFIVYRECNHNKINNLNSFVKILLIFFLMIAGVFCEVFLKKIL